MKYKLAGALGGKNKGNLKCINGLFLPVLQGLKVKKTQTTYLMY